MTAYRSPSRANFSLSPRTLRFGIIATVLAAAPAGVAFAGGHRIPDSPPPQPPELFQNYNDTQALGPAMIERPPYRLNTADVLEIIYHVKVGRLAEDVRPYELQTEDVIAIKFPFAPELSQTCVVLADGSINCLLIGKTRAYGYSPQQLEELLRQAYKRYIKNPELTVIVQEANKKIDELKKAITTAPRGQSRLMPVKPDGTIDLPFVGEIYAFGKTVAELRTTLNKAYYENDLEEIEVTVQLLEFAPRRVYLMGEVANVGMFTMPHPVTLIQAITAAGGPKVSRADLEHVLIVRRKYLPIPQAVICNVQQLLDGKKPSPDGLVPNGEGFRHDFWLQDEDFIFVPRTGLATTTDWIDMVFARGIRQILPVSGNVGVNFGYDIYNAPAAFTQNVGGSRFNTVLGP